MTMSTSKLSILLHYYAGEGDWAGDRSSEIAKRRFSSLIDLGLLEPFVINNLVEDQESEPPEFAISDRGRAYVDAILQTPLPVQAWVIPGRAPTP